MKTQQLEKKKQQIFEHDFTTNLTLKTSFMYFAIYFILFSLITWTFCGIYGYFYHKRLNNN